MNDKSDVGKSARAALAAGISIVPPKEDGSKRPVVKWKSYQTTPASADQVERWYGPRTGLGFITGAVSGGLELFEFDADLYDEFKATADALGLGPVFERVENGYLERSPGGGWHLFYYCDEITGNTALAHRPGPLNPETGKPTPIVMIETRGEGGFAVVAPSSGNVHPSGGRYELIKGGIGTIATISGVERGQLWDLARTFDRMPPDEGDSPPDDRRKVGKPPDGGRSDGPRPGDDFNVRTTWDDLLIPRGWTRLYTRGGTTYWRRPQKSEGWSATTNHNGSGLLWVFTSSTEFAAKRSYDLFGAYATLEHGGVFEVAAKCLGEQGYGTPKRAKGSGRNDGGRPPVSGTARAGDEDGTPSDLAARVRAQVESHGIAGLLRNAALLAEMSILEDEDPAEYGAILAELKKNRTFTARLFAAAIREAKPADRRGLADHPYYEKGGCLFAGLERLSNFTARIAEEIIRDDGSEEARIFFRIDGKGPGGRPLFAEVKAEEFEAMRWVVANFGAMAIIEAGRDVKGHVRAAIQYLSNDVPRRIVYTHTGWRKIEGEWKYLHAGGAIGADGPDTSIIVDLVPNLKRYHLPTPPAGALLAKSIRASLRILNLGQTGRPSSRSLAAVILAAAYRAVIGDVACSIKFTGPSGSLKSSAAALAQQHFGPGMNFDNLPAAWEGTGNGFEGLLHATKDTLVTIDDFAPVGSAADVARDHKTADRTIRGAANHQGRLRMNADGTAQVSKPPRGMILSTGEDGFQKHSANARTIPIQFSAGDDDRHGATVDIKLLTECQAEADAGLYAGAMAAYIQWLSPRLDEVKADFPGKVQALRPLMSPQGAHLRTATAVADLAAGFDLFLEFAVEKGAIGANQRGQARQLVRDGLMEAAEEAASENLDEGSPVDRYIGLLVSALSGIRAHIVDSKTGDIPVRDLGTLCGWHEELKYQGGDKGLLPVWMPGSGTPKIGWTDGDFVYLDPENAYKVALQMIAGRSDISMPSRQQLHRQLRDAGKLAFTDPRNGSDGRNRFTCRVSLEKKQRNVLVMRASDFWGAHDEPKVSHFTFEDAEIREPMGCWPQST